MEKGIKEMLENNTNNKQFTLDFFVETLIKDVLDKNLPIAKRKEITNEEVLRVADYIKNNYPCHSNTIPLDSFVKESVLFYLENRDLVNGTVNWLTEKEELILCDGFIPGCSLEWCNDNGGFLMSSEDWCKINCVKYPCKKIEDSKRINKRRKELGYALNILSYTPFYDEELYDIFEDGEDCVTKEFAKEIFNALKENASAHNASLTMRKINELINDFLTL